MFTFFVSATIVIVWLVITQLYAEKLFPFQRTFNGRIIGGEETSIENHPYQASIQYFGFHYCGAAVISESYVVSAAHCMSG